MTYIPRDLTTSIKETLKHFPLIFINAHSKTSNTQILNYLAIYSKILSPQNYSNNSPSQQHKCSSIISAQAMVLGSISYWNLQARNSQASK